MLTKKKAVITGYRDDGIVICTTGGQRVEDDANLRIDVTDGSEVGCSQVVCGGGIQVANQRHGIILVAQFE